MFFKDDGINNQSHISFKITSNLMKRMHDYGYEWDGMLPLKKSSAINLFKKGQAVFLLYPDNTEGEALSVNDINTHANKGGMFGIEKQM